MLELEKAAEVAMARQAGRATKRWPHDDLQLNALLAAADRAVVAAHPKGHRTNGYFARLMQFLPFSKQVLRGAMQRGERRVAAAAAEEALAEKLRELAGLLQVCLFWVL
jgi:hypothetical protein